MKSPALSAARTTAHDVLLAANVMRSSGWATLAMLLVSACSSAGGKSATQGQQADTTDPAPAATPTRWDITIVGLNFSDAPPLGNYASWKDYWRLPFPRVKGRYFYQTDGLGAIAGDEESTGVLKQALQDEVGLSMRSDPGKNAMTFSVEIEDVGYTETTLLGQCDLNLNQDLDMPPNLSASPDNYVMQCNGFTLLVAVNNPTP